MIDKISTLNDLASVDMGFAELYNEKGINPFPFVCDGFDLSFLDEDDGKTLGDKFASAKTKLDELIEKLDGERTIENSEQIDKLINNLKERSNLIEQNKDNFKKGDFSFPDLYLNLKQLQNNLGISIPFPELNIINFMGDNVDTDVLKEKMLEYVQKVQRFMQQSEQAYNAFNKSQQVEKLAEVAQTQQETMNKDIEQVANKESDTKKQKKETKANDKKEENSQQQ